MLTTFSTTVIMPRLVTIPAGASSATFTIDVIGDLSDGRTKYATITPLAPSHNSRSLSIQILADDHGNDAASATRVLAPSSPSGRIDFAGDSDWFRFDVEAGLAYSGKVT